MIVAYDGSSFSGFQLQPGVPTIQGELEKAAGSILDERVRVSGSGRTDTGVHALGQVVTFKTACPIPIDKLIVSMNRLLPGSIRIRSIESAADDFHARFSAKGKQYRYLIKSVQAASPFLERFFFQVPHPLDLDRMKSGAAEYLGLHHFGSFTKSPDPQEDLNREIYESRITLEGDVIVYDVVGSGFLHNMVRNMVKALVLLGLQKMQPGEITELYRNQDRRRLGAPAPPGGLYLMKVMY
jgi:tRNA pseudouridine38-40 synthase